MHPVLQANIVKALGFDALSADKQTELLSTIGTIIYQRIMLRVLEELSETDKDEFDLLLGKEQRGGDELYQFLQSKIPHLSQLVHEEIVKFKQASLRFMEATADKK